MPQTAEDVVSAAFADAVGGSAATGGATAGDAIPMRSEDLTGALAQTGQQLDALRSSTVSQAEAVSGNTQAVAENTTAHAVSGVTQAMSTVSSLTSGLLGNVLGAMPLVSGIISLFSGDGQSTAPAPLVRYTSAPALAFQGTAAYQPLSYGQDGVPRPAGDPASSGEAGAPPAAQTANAPQVTIQVQAMDSRSFLDHSQDIARAVREAMLNMDRLNDVISEM